MVVAKKDGIVVCPDCGTEIALNKDIILINNNLKSKHHARNSAEKIINHLNNKLGLKGNHRFRPTATSTIESLTNTFKQGFTESDALRVIDNMVAANKGTRYEYMLTPQHLFGKKFETYLHWKPKDKPQITKQRAGVVTYNGPPQ